ncbi:MAG: hypothetical protein SNH79_06250 [Rikenellaceae bacterium]
MRGFISRCFAPFAAAFAVAVAASSFSSCMKDELYDCNLIFKNTVLLSSDEDAVSVPLSGVEIYAFAPYATLIEDKSDEAYSVASYEDAVAGILTNDVTGEAASYGILTEAIPFASSYAGYEDALAMSVALERVFIVAIDTENKGFAYINYSVGLNLSQTYIALDWLAWKSGFYKQGSWTFYAEN